MQMMSINFLKVTLAPMILLVFQKKVIEHPFIWQMVVALMITLVSKLRQGMISRLVAADTRDCGIE